MMRVGLYAKVSTHDQQTLPMQLSAMRDYAECRGWEVVKETSEIGSGAKERQKREQLVKAARRREIVRSYGVSPLTQLPNVAGCARYPALVASSVCPPHPAHEGFAS